MNAPLSLNEMQQRKYSLKGFVVLIENSFQKIFIKLEYD